LRLWQVHIDKVLKAMSNVHVGASVRNLHVAPPVKRSKEHAQVAYAGALLFLSIAMRLARLAREGGAGFFDLLLTRFLYAHQHMRGRLWTMRDCQGGLPGTHQVGIGRGRETPPFVEPRCESIFFRVRRTVSSERLSTPWSATSLSAESGMVHLA
jgi:hypothetical protein